MHIYEVSLTACTLYVGSRLHRFVFVSRAKKSKVRGISSGVSSERLAGGFEGVYWWTVDLGG